MCMYACLLVFYSNIHNYIHVMMYVHCLYLTLYPHAHTIIMHAALHHKVDALMGVPEACRKANEVSPGAIAAEKGPENPRPNNLLT